MKYVITIVRNGIKYIVFRTPVNLGGHFFSVLACTIVQLQDRIISEVFTIRNLFSNDFENCVPILS